MKFKLQRDAAPATCRLSQDATGSAHGCTRQTRTCDGRPATQCRCCVAMQIMRKLSGAKDKLGLRVHGLIVGSPEKKRADPAVLRALCTAYLPNGRSEVLAGLTAQGCSYTHTSCAKLAVVMS